MISYILPLCPPSTHRNSVVWNSPIPDPVCAGDSFAFCFVYFSQTLPQPPTAQQSVGAQAGDSTTLWPQIRLESLPSSSPRAAKSRRQSQTADFGGGMKRSQKSFPIISVSPPPYVLQVSASLDDEPTLVEKSVLKCERFESLCQ